MSGECLVCGGIETVVNPHDKCVIGLIEKYAACVIPPGSSTHESAESGEVGNRE
jgi:hypothetical protein